MNPLTVAEALRQVIEGKDFDPVEKLLRVKVDVAFAKPEDFPYSIAGNLWHCDYWNRLWLIRLKGEKCPYKNIWAEDWHDPSPEEWTAVQQSLLSNLQEAHRIAASSPFKHAMKSDDEAVETLNQIAVHTAYHIGQTILLKRILRARAKSDEK